MAGKIRCGGPCRLADMKVENGKVTAFRTRVSLSFKYES
jgi:hypothetical protein